MDIYQLYNDYSIDYRTEGHKHCRPGWINTECPFCSGNPGYHLGYHINSNIFVCWRCGWHPITLTISKLLRIELKEIYQILKNYAIYIPNENNLRYVKVNKKFHKFPSGVIPLEKKHINYLIKRNFDPEQIEKEWKIVGTGPISFLDKIDYRFRIIVPIIWKNQQVSFQGRDITDKNNLRYKACPEVREIIKHKDILYGNSNKWRFTGICVEGITDVWRLGPSSFATFGIKYTPNQLRVIAKTFKRVPIFYDPDPQAIIQANKLCADLKFRGVDAFLITEKTDPAEMSQEEANYLVKNLTKNNTYVHFRR